MFFDLNELVSTFIEEPADHLLEEPTDQPIEEPADQLVGHLANPPNTLVDDVYYSIDDFMGTVPPDSQVAAAVVN